MKSLTAVLLVTSFVLVVLLLNEREASGKVAEQRETAAKNYRAAEKWFITAVSMASNEQEIVNALTEIQRKGNRKWHQDWHGDKEMKMSNKDQRLIDNSILEYLLKMHSERKADGAAA